MFKSKWGYGYRAWYIPIMIKGDYIRIHNYVAYGFIDWPSRCEWIVPGTIND